MNINSEFLISIFRVRVINSPDIRSEKPFSQQIDAYIINRHYPHLQHPTFVLLRVFICEIGFG